MIHHNGDAFLKLNFLPAYIRCPTQRPREVCRKRRSTSLARSKAYHELVHKIWNDLFCKTPHRFTVLNYFHFPTIRREICVKMHFSSKICALRVPKNFLPQPHRPTSLKNKTRYTPPKSHKIRPTSVGCMGGHSLRFPLRSIALEIRY